MQCAAPLGNSSIGYDPVGFSDGCPHAGVTGGIVQRVLAAVRVNSPAVYRELRTFLPRDSNNTIPRQAKLTSNSEAQSAAATGHEYARHFDATIYLKQLLLMIPRTGT